MFCYVATHHSAGDTRTSLTPATAQALRKLGLAVHAPRDLGRASHYADSEYRDAGVTIVEDPTSALQAADLVLRVRKPTLTEVGQLKRGATHLSFLDPFNEPDLIAAFATAGVSAVSMEMIPRTTIAQKM